MIASNEIMWVVPEGYLHYVVDHNVHPSEKFIEFLKNLTEENVTYKNISGLISN